MFLLEQREHPRAARRRAILTAVCGSYVVALVLLTQRFLPQLSTGGLARPWPKLLTTLLLPGRLLTAPIFASGPGATLLAALPIALLAFVQLEIVLRSRAPFEESSLEWAKENEARQAAGRRAVRPRGSLSRRWQTFDLASAGQSRGRHPVEEPDARLAPSAQARDGRSGRVLRGARRSRMDPADLPGDLRHDRDRGPHHRRDGSALRRNVVAQRPAHRALAPRAGAHVARPARAVRPGRGRVARAAQHARRLLRPGARARGLRGRADRLGARRLDRLHPRPGRARRLGDDARAPRADRIRPSAGGGSLRHGGHAERGHALHPGLDDPHARHAARHRRASDGT